MKLPTHYVLMPDGSYSSPSSLARLGAAVAMSTASEAREQYTHDKIVSYCRSKGWRFIHSRMDVPATTECGSPDFVIAMPEGRTVWVEVKTAKGKVRPEQAAWVAALKCLGHSAHIVRSYEEFLEVVK